MFSISLKSILSASLLLAGSAMSLGGAAAQEQQFIYASYFTCPGGKLSTVDKVVSDELAPIYDAATEDGTIKGWGWSTHHSGGQWQRIFSIQGGNVDELIKGIDVVNKRIDDAKVDPDNKFGKACNMHDDYIWEIKAGKGSEREGKAALSTYFQCDISKGERADEIVANNFAGFYNANIGEGKLTSWTWASHYMGGKYRKGLWISAENYTDLLKAQDTIIAAVYGDDNPEGMEFAKICSSHTDYLWNRN